MLTTDELPAILKALETYKGAHASALPAELADRIYELSIGSSVDTIVKTAETLYAARDVIGDAGRQMMAELFYTASYYNWRSVNVDARAGRIIAAVRRDLGEDAPAMAWPAAGADPEAKPEYAVLPAPAPEASDG